MLRPHIILTLLQTKKPVSVLPKTGFYLLLLKSCQLMVEKARLRLTVLPVALATIAFPTITNI